MDKLSPHKPQDKAILHELAFNDDDPKVILAALARLNSFALWQKSAQLARLETVKRTAREHVQQFILATELTQGDRQQRDDYLRESATIDLVKTALLQPVPDLSEKLIIGLLDKIGQPDFTQRYFHKLASENIKHTVIEQTDSLAILDRLAKKETDAAILSIISQRREALHQATHMPAQVQQQVTLVLSKLNALLDKADYADIAARFEILNKEYTALTEQYTWLSEDGVATNKQKYHQIQVQLTRHLARLKPEWEAAQAQLARQQAFTATQTQLQQANAMVTHLFEDTLATASLQQVAEARQQLTSAEQALAHLTTLVEKSSTEDTKPQGRAPYQLGPLHSELVALQQKLEKFENQQAIAQQLAELVQQAEQLNSQAPNQPEQQTSLQQRWDALTKQLISLPEPLLRQWNQQTRAWKQQKVAAANEQQQAIKACRKHLNIVDNLIEQGRFRPAMGRFQQAQKVFEELSAQSQQSLQKRFEQTRQRVERLAGWQTYLAAPRKPELLKQARQLAAAPADNISQRAAQVKDLRAQWQSLTQPQEDNNDDRQAFDEALASAFEPCRQYFAQQEANRETARREREALIEQAAALNAETEPSILARNVEQLRQAWRNTGQTQKPVYEALKKRWESTLAPLLHEVQQWHSTNRAHKQSLIDQAVSLSAQDDHGEAIETAKQLQQQWKAIGSAGRHENKMWREFRQANDRLFDAAKQARQASTEAHQQRAKALLQEASEAAKQADSLARFEELNDEAASLPAPVQRQVQQKLARLQARAERQHDEHARQQQSARQAKYYEALLDAIEHWQGEPETIEGTAKDHVPAAVWACLSRAHQHALEGAVVAHKNRQWYTTQLEVLCDLPSPDSYQNVRQDVQLAMMMHKLEQGQSDSIDEVIARWLACGPVTKNEAALVQRFGNVIRTCFITPQQDEPSESAH